MNFYQQQQLTILQQNATTNIAQPSQPPKSQAVHQAKFLQIAPEEMRLTDVPLLLKEYKSLAKLAADCVVIQHQKRE